MKLTKKTYNYLRLHLGYSEHDIEDAKKHLPEMKIYYNDGTMPFVFSPYNRECVPQYKMISMGKAYNILKNAKRSWIDNDNKTPKEWADNHFWRMAVNSYCRYPMSINFPTEDGLMVELVFTFKNKC